MGFQRKENMILDRILLLVVPLRLRNLLLGTVERVFA